MTINQRNEQTLIRPITLSITAKQELQQERKQQIIHQDERKQHIKYQQKQQETKQHCHQYYNNNKSNKVLLDRMEVVGSNPSKDLVQHKL
jgi:hypothetical protein